MKLSIVQKYGKCPSFRARDIPTDPNGEEAAIRGGLGEGGGVDRL
jgi:hypothetical protein